MSTGFTLNISNILIISGLILQLFFLADKIFNDSKLKISRLSIRVEKFSPVFGASGNPVE